MISEFSENFWGSEDELRLLWLETTIASLSLGALFLILAQNISDTLFYTGILLVLFSFYTIALAVLTYPFSVA